MTPKPRLVDPKPEGLPYPLILEEYLPGSPLDYANDGPAAARCVAAVHALGVPDGHRLQVHPDPAPAILEESRVLAEPYLSWDGAPEGSKAVLRRGIARIEGFLERDDLFTGDDLVIVNYDLNTHNFVVGEGVAVAGLFAFLISWGQYVLTLLIGGGNVVTLPMLLFSSASGSDPVITSALALVFAVPAILALVLALRVLKPGQRTNVIGTGKV